MCSSVAPAASTQRRSVVLDQVDVVEPLGAVQIDDQMHAGAAHAVADREMVLTLVVDRRDDRDLGNLACLSFGRCLGSPKPFSDRKRAFWRIAVLPNQ